MSITVFSKHKCKFCAMAKSLLETKSNVQVTYIYLDEQAVYDDARAEMMRLMGLSPDAPRPTVPQIFFGTEHFPGGATALLKLQEDGLLDSKIQRTPKVGSKEFPPEPIGAAWSWKRIEYNPDDF